MSSRPEAAPVAERSPRWRGRGAVMLAAASAIAFTAIAVAFVPWGRSEIPAPVEFGRASDVSDTPLVRSVQAQVGADRVLQRAPSSLACTGAPAMGCPQAVQTRAVPFFLTRDSAGAIRAFIGQDPRNGCGLVVRTDLPHGYPFYDPCHGSIYDRDGHVVGGPSPWDLNEWAVDTKDGALFVDPSKIKVGAAPGIGRQ